MLDTLQAFLALNLDVGSIRRVATLQRALRNIPDGPSGSVAWVTPTNLHVAVRVLGDTDRSAAPALMDSLRGIADGLSGVRLQLGAPEAYPNAEHARLLLVRVADGSGVLAQVIDAVEQAVQRFGFVPVAQPVEPVLVLGRLREAVDTTAWLAAAGSSPVGEARVTELVLYSTEVEHPGAEYTALGRLAVAAPIAARSQRPSRAPKPSQRPRPRSKPPAADGTARPAENTVSIPKPPRLPSVPAPGPSAAADAASPPGPEIPPPPLSRPVMSPLPPALEAALPDEDDWK